MNFVDIYMWVAAIMTAIGIVGVLMLSAAFMYMMIAGGGI